MCVYNIDERMKNRLYDSKEDYEAGCNAYK